MGALVFPVLAVFVVLFFRACVRADGAYSPRDAARRSLGSVGALLAGALAVVAFAIADFVQNEGPLFYDSAPAPPRTTKQTVISVLLTIGVAFVVVGVEWAHYRLWRRYRPMWAFFALLPLYPFACVFARDRLLGYR